jgi:hypothetical protein
MPVAQCFPVRREALTLDCSTLDADGVGRYERTADALLSGPGVYRKRFRAARPRDRSDATSEPFGEGAAKVGGVEE